MAQCSSTGDGDAALKIARKRNRPADKTLPKFDNTSSSLASTSTSDTSLAALSTSYCKLQKMEKDLDTKVSRKKLEIMDTLGTSGLHAGNLGTPAGKVGKIRRKLRVCVWNECEGMEWQAQANGGVKEEEESEQKKPQWTLKISGKLLDVRILLDRVLRMSLTEMI